MQHLRFGNNKLYTYHGLRNQGKGSFWREVFFSFYIVYKKIILIGTFIFVICMVSLHVQKKYPYQYRQREMVQEESVKEDMTEEVQPSVETEAFGDGADLSERDDFEYKYGYKYEKYKVKYKGKMGVKKRKAEQLLEEYLYYEWDSGIMVSQRLIKMPAFTNPSVYKVIHVRKMNSKKIAAYIKIASGEYKDSLIKFEVESEENGTYRMSYS